MQNLNLLQDALKNNGQALAYQFLDGMNWKQHTYSDIKHSLDNTIAYLLTNGFENKKVLSCASTTLENFLTLNCLEALNCSINYDSDINNLNKNFDILVMDEIDESNKINTNEYFSVISLNSPIKKEIENKNLITFKTINKFGMMSKKKIDESKICELMGTDLNNISNSDKIKLEKIISEISETEFVNIFYQNSVKFGNSICSGLLKGKKKFINFKNWMEFITNINETIPTYLFIDSDNLKKTYDFCIQKKINLKFFLGGKVKKIICHNLVDSNLNEDLNAIGIELVNI